MDLCMKCPSEVAVSPLPNTGSEEQGQQGLKWVQGPGGDGAGETVGELCEGPSLQQPLQARQVLRGGCPSVALPVNT